MGICKIFDEALSLILLPHILGGNKFESIAAIEVSYSILKTLQVMWAEIFMAEGVSPLQQGLKCLST